jgi:excisionase family DNA binding protein
MSDIRLIENRLDRIEKLITGLYRPSPWLNGIPEVSKYLGFGRTKTVEIINNGLIKSYRVGRTIMVKKIDVDAAVMFGKSFQKLTRPQKAVVKDHE